MKKKKKKSFSQSCLFNTNDRMQCKRSCQAPSIAFNTCTVRAEIFAVVLFSRISRGKPSRKFPLQFMSIYSNYNISKIAKLTTRELPHLAKTAKITVRENFSSYSTIILTFDITLRHTGVRGGGGAGSCSPTPRVLQWPFPSTKKIKNSRKATWFWGNIQRHLPLGSLLRKLKGFVNPKLKGFVNPKLKGFVNPKLKRVR